MKRAIARLLASVPCLVLCAFAGSVALSSPAYGNSAPVLSPIGNQSVQRGAELSIQITASDPDLDPVTITPTGAPAYAFFEDFGGTAYLTVMPPSTEPPSLIPITMTVSDGQLSSSETFILKVYPAGNPNSPVLDAIGDATVAEGQTSSVPVSASDADNNVLSFSSSLPAFASLASTGSAPGAASASLSLAPGSCAAGTYAASVTVSDGAWTATQTFTITVTDVNRVPVWTVPAGGYVMTVNEGSSGNRNVTATDPDQSCGSAPPMISLASTPTALTATLTDLGNGTGQLHVAAGYDAAGTYQVMVRASDTGLTADVGVQVTVLNVNRPPVASAGGPYTGSMGSSMTMSGEGSSDADGDALTYAWVYGDGYTGSGVTTSHTYTTGGTFTVCLTVTDNGTPALSDTKCTTAVVQRVNRRPVAAPGGPYTGYAGANVNVNSTGSSDPDGDLITCAWSFGDGGTGIGATAGHTYVEPGTYTVSLTVTDHGTPSLSDTSSTTATVVSVRPSFYAARVTSKNKVQLNTDGQYHPFRVEPVGACFALRDVRLNTIVMKSGGLQVPAASASLVRDSDRNGVSEVLAYFTAPALQTLFAAAPFGRSNVTVTLEGDLASGGKFRGDVSFQIKKDNDGGQSVSISPNPFNPQATLSFTMAQRGAARVTLYDLSGRLVRTLMDESDAAAGHHAVTIDGRTSAGARMASGVYFYRVETSAGVARGQLVVMK